MALRQFENTSKLFEKIKTIGFFERLFSWKNITHLVIDSVTEFKSIDKEFDMLNNKYQELNIEAKTLEKENSNLKESKTELQKERDKLKDDKERNTSELKQKEKELGKLKESDDKNTKRISELLSDIKILESKRDELIEKNTEFEKKITAFEKLEKKKEEEYKQDVTKLNSLKEQMDNDRKLILEEREKEIQERFEKMKETWREHEKKVEEAILNISTKYQIDYFSKDKVPFKGSPDNTIKICDEYIIFDAKSPSSDDNLDNFSSYIKNQTENVKKYIRQKEVKKEIFLVVPSNTLEILDQFYYNMSEYNVYVLAIDSLEPVILSLKKVEEYEFAEKLSPEDRDNICRVIGRFAHTTKRRIQIDGFFASEFMDIFNKCYDLPKEILNGAEKSEKASKLNPPQDKRAKVIQIDEISKEVKRIKKEAEAKDIDTKADLNIIESVPLYKVDDN